MAARFDWISDLPAPAKSALDAAAKPRRFGNRKLIYAKGDTVEACYQIVSGGMRQFAVDAAGRETLVNLYRVGEVVADSSAVAGEPYPQWLEAKGETLVRQWTTSDLKRLRFQFPEIQEALIQQTSRRLHSLLTFLEQLSTLSSADRIAARLLHMLDGDDGSAQTLACSQSDIAAMTHSTRQTVNETLARLKRLGILDNRYGRIKVHDVPGLQRSFKRTQ